RKGQLRIVLSARHRFNVRHALFLGPLANPGQPVLPNIFRVDFSLRTYTLGQVEREVARAAADVRDHAARLDAESVHHLVGTLPGVAFLPAILSSKPSGIE